MSGDQKAAAQRQLSRWVATKARSEDFLAQATA
jgi:hypothetical protein